MKRMMKGGRGWRPAGVFRGCIRGWPIGAELNQHSRPEAVRARDESALKHFHTEFLEDDNTRSDVSAFPRAKTASFITPKVQLGSTSGSSATGFNKGSFKFRRRDLSRINIPRYS
ncbi:uncharacterized protein LOC117227202 [Megalopta genalis]|uniref:uncharacterized protein LOC117227202 n=1 Tax=Megalopta genalis TaxID=115081 RepID=UPI003FCF67D4